MYNLLHCTLHLQKVRYELEMSNQVPDHIGYVLLHLYVEAADLFWNILCSFLCIYPHIVFSEQVMYNRLQNSEGYLKIYCFCSMIITFNVEVINVCHKNRSLAY
jgi:hypothetical protein